MMNSTIRAIIADDEKPSREVLANYLKDYCKDIEVVATASSIKTAQKAIEKHNPDVVFLDIEMPDGKGFDLLTRFENIKFRVIFVTAYSEYAIKAFRVNAVDYLLKPVKVDELTAAVDKLRNGSDEATDVDKITAVLKSMSEASFKQPTLVVSNIRGFEVMKINEIIMCKADGYCTNFYLTGNKKVISSKNLKQYEKMLCEQGFVRVHHSYLVNINHVCSVTRQGEILLAENNKAYLGDSFKKEFMRQFTRRD